MLSVTYVANIGRSNQVISLVDASFLHMCPHAGDPDARSDYGDGGQVCSALCSLSLYDKLLLYEQTALHLAALSGRAECIRLLLQNNANPLLRDLRGRHTPLEIARSRYFARCVKLLEEGEGT